MSNTKRGTRGPRRKAGAHNPETVRKANEAFMQSIDPNDKNARKRGDRIKWTEENLEDYNFTAREDKIVLGGFDNELDL